jgi:hypothetical protein
MLKPLLGVTVIAIALGGCATHIVVPPAPGCPVPASLVEDCPKPAALEDGINYGDLLLKQQSDRRSLELCASNQRALKRLVAECKAELERYNASLQRSLNAEQGK